MTEIAVNIEIYCGKCGAGICGNASPRTRSGYNKDEPTFDVVPCEACLEEARQEGHDAGHSEGHGEGHSEGYDEGYENGKNDAESD